MKRIATTILLTLLWLVLVSAVQAQPRFYPHLDTTTSFNPPLVSRTVVTDLAVPEIRVWPLDGSLVSWDGQAPVQSRGITFVAGRFDRAVEFSRASNSALIYRAAGNVAANEGSLTLWIRPTYDLTDTAYLDHPHVFSYAIDHDNQLAIAIGDGCVMLQQRIQGRLLPETCLPIANWPAGEWHHLAVTWSASAQQATLYADCASGSTGPYLAMTGNAAVFQLGSAAADQTIDAVLDEVRLSRRALTSHEIAAICRDRPLSRHKTIEANASLAPTPLGTLQPITGLLPNGTISFTLNLTTTAPAACRWSEITATQYVSMPHDFQIGQGTVSHRTPINVAALDDRHFYVRCQDLATGRDPDNTEQQTHVRVLGPTSNRYPRLANLWNDFTTQPDIEAVAGFDLHIVFGGVKQALQAPEIRAADPNAKVLLTVQATYGVPGIDSPATEWWGSQPGDPDYNCLLRNTQGSILLVSYWNHPMYNLTVPYCRTVLANLSSGAFLSLDQNWGADLAYDGLYWDRLHDTIGWLGSDIDSNLDGQADAPAEVNAAYQAGVKDFLAQVRARVPHAILTGNDAASLGYAAWINGRYFETQVAALLDGGPITWTGMMQDYRTWAGNGVTPHTTFIASSPELFYSSKFTYLYTNQMPPAMRAEAAASYSRMRYGLATALMGDGLFAYDYGPDGHGDRWWYDEYGASGGSSATHPSTETLPARGYLGQAGNAPFKLGGVLHSSDQVINGNFNNGLNNWIGWIEPNSGAEGRFKVSETGGLGGTAAAHIVISETDNLDSIEFRQLNKSTVANRPYTVSFWGRSTQAVHPIEVQLIVNPTPWVGTGYRVQATLTPEWRLFRLTDVSVRTRNDLRLVFQVGSEIGKIWLDDIQFQEGEPGAWARSFEKGLVVINPGGVTQTVSLPGVYRKLTGDQAPLFQARLDDNDLLASGNWTKSPASFAQFGSTVYTTTSLNPAATVVYHPNLLHGGTYQVLAWVVPTTTQSSAVEVTVHHADGETTIMLDETQGEIGWRDLGTYRFNAGNSGYAVLSATGTGLVIADAFKWVSTARYNDGQTVWTIDLQPQDAIVLLRTHELFLPLLRRAAP